ncbi:MAG: hypothetical protein LKI93_04855 [Bifidobacteriaceae bacterium]|jgi:hypothetical protein|nr:hypothetical protein [Bifidobacteriaceae bacterium]MCI1914396.1 hypothetical protein [Bifidobacteriaceae bacterium]MCI1935848.1 hypothetical protein [Bifidobacteriaceae bacterium]
MLQEVREMEAQRRAQEKRKIEEELETKGRWQKQKKNYLTVITFCSLIYVVSAIIAFRAPAFGTVAWVHPLEYFVSFAVLVVMAVSLGIGTKLSNDRWWGYWVAFGLEIAWYLIYSLIVFADWNGTIANDNRAAQSAIFHLASFGMVLLMLIFSVISLYIGIRNKNIYGSPGKFRRLTIYPILVTCMIVIAASNFNQLLAMSPLFTAILGFMVLNRASDTWDAWNEEPTKVELI